MTLIAFLMALSTAPAKADSHAEGVLSQKQIQAAKELMDTSRNFALILNLDFTEEENEEFWPLYDEYREEIRGVRERKLSLIDEYAARYGNDTVDDEFADRAIKDSIKIQIDTAKIRDKYWKKFRRIIPATKAARFYQLENKMDAEVEYILAGGVPLIETK
jgi:hypothetical protein